MHQVPGTDQPPQDDRSAAGVLAAALGVTLTENPSPPALSLEWQPHIVAAAQALSQTSGGTPEQHWAQAQAAVLGGVGTAAGLAPQAALEEERIAEAMNRRNGRWPGYFLSQLLAGSAGEDWKRLDHANVIADDAYLRYLDRQRLLDGARMSVIATETGITGLDPADAAEFQAAWNAAVVARERSASVPADDAAAQLDAEVTAIATAQWQQLHAGETFDADGDWAGAARNLTVDRAARYAYYRWLARSRQPEPQPDLRLEDWLAGETAALYGTAAFDAARDHFVSYVRPGGALPAITAGNQPYGVLIACALDTWHPAGGEQRMRAFVQALLALRDTVWTLATNQVPRLGPDPVSDVTTAAGDPAAAARHEPGQPAGFRARARRPRLCPQPLALRPDAAQCRLGHRNDGKQHPAAARHRDRLDAAAGRTDRRRGIRAADRRPGRHGRPSTSNGFPGWHQPPAPRCAPSRTPRARARTPRCFTGCCVTPRCAPTPTRPSASSWRRDCSATGSTWTRS